MKRFGFYLVVLLWVAAVSSCSVPGSAAMGQLKEGMSKDQVRAVMQSHGLAPDDSRKRPAGGWKSHGNDPFEAGSKASQFESETGHRVASAEIYHIPGDRGSSIINLYYDDSGRLVR
ncbi:MAG: hypothetical protein ACPG4K_06390 [Haloferula sp.]